MKTLFVIASVYLHVVAAIASPMTPQFCHIEGVVASRFGLTDDASVSGAAVTLTGRGMLREVATAGDGTYAFDVPPGRYRLSVKGLGFCHVRRASFVADQSGATINMYLYPCALVNSLVKDAGGTYVGERCSYSDPLQTTEFRVTNASGGTRDLVIRYGHRKDTRRGMLLSAPPPDSQTVHQVVASVDTLTVYADSMIYSSSRDMLFARGNVLVDSGARRIRATAVDIDLRSAPPTVHERE
jgi:hypothetical protein